MKGKKSAEVLRVTQKSKGGELPLSPKALTRVEQLVLQKLAESTHLKNGWQIYLEVFEVLVIGDAGIKYVPSARGSSTRYISKGNLPTDKEELARIAAFTRKQKGVDVPNYSRVVRILEDMVAAGWVQKRTKGLGKAIAAYYLDDDMEEQVKILFKKRK